MAARPQARSQARNRRALALIDAIQQLDCARQRLVVSEKGLSRGHRTRTRAGNFRAGRKFRDRLDC